MYKKDLLKGKTILVTGGGTGLGKEMASHYAEHGANLYICGRRENVLKDTASEIIDKYGTIVKYETLNRDLGRALFLALLRKGIRILSNPWWQPRGGSRED